MKIKQFLAMILLVVLMLTILPLHAEAAVIDSGKCGQNLTWTRDDEGTVTISGTGSMWNYDTNQNYSPWSGSHKVKKVVISNGVTSIGDYAFYNCLSLTSISLSDTVRTIGYRAFYWCDAITNVKIPDGVTTIEGEAFGQCCNLISVTIGNGVTMIDVQAFSGCSKLNNVTLGNSVKTIGNSAFANCIRLTEIVIPDSVATIKSSAFSGCRNLKSITFGNGIKAIGSAAFSDCTNLAGVSLPNSLITIGSSAFLNCSNLTSATIGSSVTSIGSSAFSGCSSLTNISIPGKVSTIDDKAFYGCSSLASVDIGNSVTTIGTSAFQLCRNLKRVAIPLNVSSIGDNAFRACTNLTEIRVAWNNQYYSSDDKGILFDKNKTVLIHAPGAYVGSYTIPDSVTTIQDYAFAGCLYLKSVTIGSNITNIPEYAFYGCSSLNSLILGHNVGYIGHRAFKDCNGLLTVCYAGTQQQWKEIKIVWDNSGISNANIHFDNNIDHVCDTCGNAVSACVDKNKDDTCDICGKVIPIPVPAKPYKIANVVSGVHVYWKAIAGVEKYGVWRSETGKDGTYKWLANPTVPHFTDTTAVSGKTYYYKISSMNAVSGKHSNKSEAIGITFVDTPDITSRENTSQGIKLGWQKISGATGYAIYRKVGSNDWARVATIEGGSTLSWTDTAVKSGNGTTYKYTIRALYGTTLSGCRNTGRTMVRLFTPTISSAAAHASKDGTAFLRWNKNAKATGYEVRFLLDGKVAKTFTVTNVNTVARSFEGLTEGKTYTVQVRSYFKTPSAGTYYSAWSTAKSVKI